MSDMHIEPDAPGSQARHSAQGFIAALDSVKQLSPQPQFIVTGGDHIMDALERPLDDVRRQWELYRSTVAAHCAYRTYPVIGNHDVFGWMTDAVPPETPGYGKSLACQMLGLTKPYYSFDIPGSPTDPSAPGGWHIVVLDNTQPCPRGYFGGLDGSQTQWLARDLAAVPPGRHIAVVSHIPILSVCAQHFFAPEQRVDFWKIYDVFVHHDSRDLVDLLARHKVKLCISAHIHMLDRIEFRGITFICDGSISGDWWRGPFRGFPQGYGVFDLYDDGTFQHQYLPYERDANATSNGKP